MTEISKAACCAIRSEIGALCSGRAANKRYTIAARTNFAVEIVTGKEVINTAAGRGRRQQRYARDD